MIRRLTVLAVLSAAAVLPASAAAVPPDSYIVVLKDNVSDTGAVARDHQRRHGADVGFVYSHALKGYSARIADGRVDSVRADSRVARIERDGDVHASATQTPATWGLDRIDQNFLPLSNSFTRPVAPTQSTTTGTPTTATVTAPTSPARPAGRALV